MKFYIIDKNSSEKLKNAWEIFESFDRIYEEMGDDKGLGSLCPGYFDDGCDCPIDRLKLFGGAITDYCRNWDINHTHVYAIVSNVYTNGYYMFFANDGFEKDLESQIVDQIKEVCEKAASIITQEMLKQLSNLAS